MTRLVFWAGPPVVGRATTIRRLAGEVCVEGEQAYRSAVASFDYELAYSSLSTQFYYSWRAQERPPGFDAVLALLRSAVALVFVIDSQCERLEANATALQCLRADLRLCGRDLDRIPTVFQLNKRDLPSAVGAEELSRRFSTERCIHLPTVATSGA